MKICLGTNIQILILLCKLFILVVVAQNVHIHNNKNRPIKSQQSTNDRTYLKFQSVLRHGNTLRGINYKTLGRNFDYNRREQSKNRNEVVVFGQGDSNLNSDSASDKDRGFDNVSVSQRVFQNITKHVESTIHENGTRKHENAPLEKLSSLSNSEHGSLLDESDFKREDNGRLKNYRSRFSELDEEDESLSEAEPELICKTQAFTPKFELPLLARSHRRDLFNCSTRCMCKYLDYSKDPHVSANCVQKRLHAIPQDLPNNLLELDISYNSISVMNLLTVYRYTNLKMLHATDCYIQNLSSAAGRSSMSLEVLDLRYNYITTLQRRSFANFKKLRILLLTGNMIQRVNQDLLSGLFSLRFLDLSLNDITSIEKTSFNDLSNLKMLSLSGNSKLGYGALTPGLFKNLRRLKALKIQGCSDGAKEYPNEAIGVLQSLQDLNIDILASPAEFGPQFARLKHLKVLRFGPHADCSQTNISKSFFQYVSNLTCLYYHSCNISGINYQAYGSFRNLEALTVEKVPSMTLDEAFIHLSGFKTKSLKYIGFKNLTNWTWPCIWMEGGQGKYMAGFNLTTINLSENRISLLSDSFIDVIPKTVEKLILRKNKFTLINTLWTTLTKLTSLTYVDVSVQNMENRNLYFPLSLERDYSLSRTFFQDANSGERGNDLHLLDKRSTRHSKDLADRSRNEGVLEIPVNLRTVKAPMYNFFGSVLLSNSIGNNSLKSLNFSRSGLHKWGSGKLPKNVEIFDVSLNAATWICQEFFHPNNSLRELYVQVNFLGEFIGGANGSVFRYLSNLKYLDLSTNVIFDIPFDFFHGLKQIETIRLVNNRIQNLNVSFENTPNLSFLDLHGNSLNWISETTRNDLDQLPDVVVDLHYNQILCTCDYIDMIRWMATTRIYFLNMHLYDCHDENNDRVRITTRKEMNLRVSYLRRHCTSDGYLVFGGVAIGLIIALAAIAGICYRNRWWIRYKKRVLFAKWFGFKPHSEGYHDGPYYKYDAFVIYVAEDRCFANVCIKELEKDRNHKLCIGDRDILPGTNEIDAIVSAVQNSRMTLIAITDNFVEELEKNFTDSPMVNYAIHMALMEEYCTNRPTLHLLQWTNCPDVNYPHYIIKVFHDDCVTQFPSANDAGVNGEMISASWDSLSAAIGHANRCRYDNGQVQGEELGAHTCCYDG